MRFSQRIVLVALALLVSSCKGETGSGSDDTMSDGQPATDIVTTTDGAPAPQAGGAGSPGTATASPMASGSELPPPVELSSGACVVGEQRPCSCPSGEGVEVCVDPSGAYGQCACDQDWPYPGDTCGANECPPMTSEADRDIQFAAQHCCTTGGACGMMTPTLGDECYERNAEPMGVADQSCEYVVDFVELVPCCRPDDKCGFWFREAPGWEDSGCVEQAEWGRRLKASGELDFFLRFVKGINPDEVLDITTASCGYAP